MNDSIVATTSSIQVGGYDALTPLLRFIFGADGLVGGLSTTGIVDFLGTVWGVFVIFAYLAAFVFLVLYIYASIELEKLEDLEKAHIEAGEAAYLADRSGATTSGRLTELQEHIESDNPNDWKLAIIEADIILDDLLKQKGYVGVSLGDRLKSISPSSLASLDDAWQAHKIRNQIAHAGADFVLTQKLARETIVQYGRVFREMGMH
jgi:hypothetical protein